MALKDYGSIRAANIPPRTGPLQRPAVLVPAVDHGKFVASTYHYLLEILR